MTLLILSIKNLLIFFFFRLFDVQNTISTIPLKSLAFKRKCANYFGHYFYYEHFTSRIWITINCCFLHTKWNRVLKWMWSQLGLQRTCQFSAKKVKEFLKFNILEKKPSFFKTSENSMTKGNKISTWLSLYSKSNSIVLDFN